MNINEVEKRLNKFFNESVDLTNTDNSHKASMLTLHFIGYIAKPTGITEDVYLKCLDAFNSHRGKFQWEEKAILDVLESCEN